jgi:UDP-N-acetylmuramate-alanine ligase
MIEDGDLVLTMGAGNIRKIGETLLDQWSNAD